MKFLHTSDWQLGRPFSHVEDPAKRQSLRQVRLDAIGRIGEAAHDNGCAFVVVAGDLFDSTTPDDTTVHEACVRIGRMGLDVYAIPGNHDHAGPDGVWEQPFFLRHAARAPNLHILVERKPVVRNDAVILPFPLFRRQDSGDVLDWIRKPGALEGLPEDRPWIALAHGSVQDFGGESDRDEDDDASVQPNLLDLDALRKAARPDFIALGDWHGCKGIAADAWYSGTPEQDRFPKGAGYRAGLALVVDVPGRGAPPVATPVETGAVRWTELSAHLSDSASLDDLARRLGGPAAGDAPGSCLRLVLDGFLGFGDRKRLDEEVLRDARAAAMRFKLEDRVVPKPSAAELDSLRNRAVDPLISRVAARLDDRSRDPARSEEDRRAALAALEQLYLLANPGNGRTPRP